MIDNQQVRAGDVLAHDRRARLRGQGGGSQGLGCRARRPSSASTARSTWQSLASIEAAKANVVQRAGGTGARPARTMSATRRCWPPTSSRRATTTGRRRSAQGRGRGERTPGAVAGGAGPARRPAGLAQGRRCQAGAGPGRASPTAQIDLDNTVIRAPVDGVVGNKGVEAGQYVKAGTLLMASRAAAQRPYRRQLQGDPAREHAAGPDRSRSPSTPFRAQS